MGYLTTWGNANKQTSEGLAIRYTCEPLELTSSPDGSSTQSTYKVTRYATKNYSFVGMDRATAMQCAEAKVAQYTRGHTKVTSMTISGDGTSTVVFVTYTVYECLCSVAAAHGNGGLWNVALSVNETDEALTESLPDDFASCFSISQNYDEGDTGDEDLLTLESVGASITSGTTAIASFKYSQKIANFSDGALCLQYKNSASATAWTTGARNVGSKTNLWYVYGASSGATFLFRLIYGGITSNVMSHTF